MTYDLVGAGLPIIDARDLPRRRLAALGSP